jgi:predicted permease
MSASGYDREHGLAFYPRLHERLQALPGVESAAYAERVPLGIEGGSWETLEVEGYAVQPTDNMRIYNNVVSPGYFDTLRIPLREGRDFRESDDGAAPPVMIVNHTFARKFFGPGPALGRRVRFGRRFSTIIGVVGDTKYRSMGEAPQPYFYIPFRQGYGADSGVVMHLRARAGAPERLLPAVRQATREIDPTVPVAVSFPYTEFMGASYFTQRVAAGMMGALGALALVLAALGLYSVMAYAVSQRTHEFGVRVAIGARPGDIVRLVFRQSFRLTALGIALGALAALALARVATSILLGVAPSDPATFAAGALLLVAVAALAAYVPARRATRVDPVVALRWE